jgi:hypothetical protein
MSAEAEEARMNEHDLAPLRAQWRSAEAKVYPLAMVDTATYKLAITSIAAVLADLRETTFSYEELATFHASPGSPSDVLQEAGRQDLWPDLIGAACATRDREIGGRMERDRQVAAFSGAESAGAEWAELPYERRFGLLSTVPEFRVHLATGLGIHTSLEPDPITGDPHLLMMPVRVNVAVGGIVEIGGDLGEAHYASDRTEWDVHAAEIQHSLVRFQ